jgi:histidyl-tRNA synthetase
VAARLLDVLTENAGDSRAMLASLRRLESPSPVLAEGLDELERVYESTLALGVPERALRINLSIVRGLDYYTGTVYETFLDEQPGLGSICSGGRYENLAGHYTKSRLPGVGISIGATRLFAQLLEMGLIAAAAASVAEVLVLQVEPALALDGARLAAELRAGGLRVELYGGDDKLGKQLKYADRARVPLALLYGSRERDAGLVKVKDLRQGAAVKEHDLPRAELVERVRALLRPGPA